MKNIDKIYKTDYSKHDIITHTFNEMVKELPRNGHIIDWIATEHYHYLENIYGADRLIFTTETFRIKDVYTQNSFCILTHEFLTGIKKTINKYNIEKISELCSGIGWLFFWLRRYGVSVIDVVDNMSWDGYKKKDFLPIVKEYDAIKYVKEHPEIEMFILSWAYMDDVAYKIWKNMRAGQYLLFIGEGDGGCCANDKFFAAVEDYSIEDCINGNLLSFYAIHDYPQLFRKG